MLNRLCALMIALLLVFPALAFSGWNIKEKDRQMLNDKMDTMKLRQKTDFVTDRSDKMLARPVTDKSIGDFTVAKVAPEVKMRILPAMTPEYFSDADAEAAWANWGKVARSEDNRFFFSVGDHRGMGCQINIYEYCPARNIVDCVVDVKKLLGWTDKTYTDGKIHGRMGIMPDGTLWAATHYGVYPDSSWFANGFRGSWLLSYNINTHEAKNWGVPLAGTNLPEFNIDTQRGKMVGTGSFATVLCWDTIEKKITYGGCPPKGWIWWERSMLLDDRTGKFWSSDMSDKTYRFLSFDPQFNKFERYEVTPPANPFTKDVGQLRAYTERRALDGAYYCVSKNGSLFRFWPEKPAVESLGTNWDKGRYTSTIALDPSGRYFYYMPGGLKMQNDNENSNIIQYDVKTGKKKIIAWLDDYYYEKYGYWVGGTYGMEISKDGSFLVIVMNGAFVTRDDEKGSPYGNPSLFVVSIPKEERPAD